MPVILVIDDERSIRTTLRVFLQKESHEVFTAETAEEALEHLKRNRVHVVVCDIILPNASGVDLLKKVKTDWPHIEFILMTGEPTFETAADAVRSGAFDYLSKPIKPDDLLRTLNKALEITSLRVQRQRLTAENDRYRQELEQLVAAKTTDLRKSEARYRAVVEDQTELICRFLPDLTITFTNAAHDRFFNIERATSEKQAFPDLFPTIQQELVKGVISRLGKSQQTASFESQLSSPDGSLRSIDWQAHAIVDADGNPQEIQAIGRDLTEKKKADRKLAEHRQRLTSLSLQLTVAEEKERHRIAADLHDWVGHSLALARVQLSRLQKVVAEPAAQESLQELSLSLRKTSQDVRDLIFDLSPPFLEELGIPGAIAEWLDGAVTKRTSLEVDFSHDQIPVELDKETAMLLYRSVRELITNTVKHAEATRVAVSFSVADGVVCCRVNDNGHGFDPATSGLKNRDSPSFGLFSIQERMQTLGGEFTLESAPGKGTKATLKLPVKTDLGA